MSDKFTRDSLSDRPRKISYNPVYKVRLKANGKRERIDVGKVRRIIGEGDMTSRRTKTGFSFYPRKERITKRHPYHFDKKAEWHITRTLSPSENKSYQYVMRVAWYRGELVKETVGFSFRQSYSNINEGEMRNEAFAMALGRCDFSPERFRVLEEYFRGYDFKVRG